jgi:phenylacetate-coenzyme A ligase PaaK-like adenylate-forming protein
MDEGDVLREGLRLCCVPASALARVVTLQTSGTTRRPKRVAFTEHDQEQTVGFFAEGLTAVARRGGAMAVMMPCRTEGGVGDLICRGLARIPVEAVRAGPMESFEATARALRASHAESIVALPAQALALARYLRAAGGEPLALEAALLSADYVPGAAVRELRAMGIRAYQHYGMTEMGFGGAIDCDAGAGQHAREPDLLFEVVDPATGAPLPAGAWGEVCFTTLTREGMPLIRYRTGDVSRLLPGACPCGGEALRLDYVRGRAREAVRLAGGPLRMPDLDEAVFALPQVMDFRATFAPGPKPSLLLEVAAFSGMAPLRAADVLEAVLALPQARVAPGLEVRAEVEPRASYAPLYPGKRRIIVRA